MNIEVFMVLLRVYWLADTKMNSFEGYRRASSCGLSCRHHGPCYFAGVGMGIASSGRAGKNGMGSGDAGRIGIPSAVGGEIGMVVKVGGEIGMVVEVGGRISMPGIFTKPVPDGSVAGAAARDWPSDELFGV